MFKLNEQDCKLININPRAEFCGDDKQLACDLKFEVTLPNTVLDLFSDNLRETLFVADSDAEKEKQAELDINSPDYLPIKKHHELGVISWDYVGAGYRVVMAYGVSGKDDIVLVNAQIDSFKFDCKDGGTIEMKFRIIAHPSAKEIGLLCELIQQNVLLTLEPPSPDQQLQTDLDEQE